MTDLLSNQQNMMQHLENERIKLQDAINEKEFMMQAHAGN
jgi:hypothetical protein